MAVGGAGPRRGAPRAPAWALGKTILLRATALLREPREKEVALALALALAAGPAAGAPRERGSAAAPPGRPPRLAGRLRLLLLVVAHALRAPARERQDTLALLS